MSADPLSSIVDINDIDLSTVETDFPILASGIVTVQVQTCEFKEGESKKEAGKINKWLDLKFALTQPHQTASHPGLTVKTINPGDRGSTISQRIYYGVSFKKDPAGKKYGIDTIAKLREAVFGKAEPGTKFIPAELLGQTLSVRLAFNPSPKNEDTGEIMGPRTEVVDYVRKAR